MAITAPANTAEWPKNKRTLIYKLTSHMWDAKQQKEVRTPKKVLDNIHYAFNLWQETSNGALRFAFGSFEKAG